MKLNYRRTFFIGFAFMAICAFWQMYDNIIPLILKNTFKMGETLTGMIMAADNVLAVFLLPIVGTLSDKVNTPIGKRTPFIVGGTAVAVISMMLLPIADGMVSEVLFIAALGVTLLAMAMYRSPAVALMPDLTPKPLRSTANAIINLMGAIGGVYTLLLIMFLIEDVENPSYMKVFIGVAVIMILSVILLLITTNENKIAKQIVEEYPEEKETKQVDTTGKKISLPKPVKRSLVFILVSILLWFMAYNAVTTAFSRYVEEVWGLEGGGFADCLMVATVAAIVSYIPIGIISSKIGRKKTILGGIVMMTLCYFGASLMDNYHAVINIGFALIGIGWAAINVNSLPMVVEMSRDSDVGKFTGLYYTFSMSAQIATPIISGALLEHVSYRTLFPYACIFSALAFITMSMVKHGDNKPTAKKKLIENFDVED